MTLVLRTTSQVLPLWSQCRQKSTEVYRPQSDVTASTVSTVNKSTSGLSQQADKPETITLRLLTACTAACLCRLRLTTRQRLRLQAARLRRLMMRATEAVAIGNRHLLSGDSELRPTHLRTLLHVLLFNKAVVWHSCCRPCRTGTSNIGVAGFLHTCYVLMYENRVYEILQSIGKFVFFRSFHPVYSALLFWHNIGRSSLHLQFSTTLNTGPTMSPNCFLPYDDIALITNCAE